MCDRIEECEELIDRLCSDDESCGVYNPAAYVAAARAQGFTDEEIAEADPEVWAAREIEPVIPLDYPDHRTLGDSKTEPMS